MVLNHFDRRLKVCNEKRKLVFRTYTRNFEIKTNFPVMYLSFLLNKVIKIMHIAQLGTA